MALSGEPLGMHLKDYSDLTEMSREGQFLNIVTKETADRNAR